MNDDRTEGIRRIELAIGQAEASPDRADVEARHGKVWTTDEMKDEFRVLGFMAPYVVVIRHDGVKGSLMFQPNPRFYFGWQEDR